MDVSTRNLLISLGYINPGHDGVAQGDDVGGAGAAAVGQGQDVPGGQGGGGSGQGVALGEAGVVDEQIGRAHV